MHVSTLPDGLDDLVLRCLKKDPAARPTARELRHLLERIDAAALPEAAQHARKALAEASAADLEARAQRFLEGNVTAAETACIAAREAPACSANFTASSTASSRYGADPETVRRRSRRRGDSAIK